MSLESLLVALRDKDASRRADEAMTRKTNAMTNDELNRKIAQWIGTHTVRVASQPRFVGMKPEPCVVIVDRQGRERVVWDGMQSSDIEFEAIPNYCNELNAIAVAESKLSRDQCEDYDAALKALPQDDSWPGTYVWHATALQRAQALEKVIG